MSYFGNILKREPNKVHFPVDEYEALIWRHPDHGHLNGYVGVNTSHHLFGVVEDSMDVCVHGGLTFSGTLNIGNDSVWYFGFDTAHYGDAYPMRPETIGYEQTYRDFRYVYRETMHLLEQIRKIGPKM